MTAGLATALAGATRPETGRPDTVGAVERRSLATLVPLAAEWRRLAARALEPNVFYEPAFALAAAPVLGADVETVLVWSAPPRRLIGLVPLRRERGRYGLPLPVLTAWTHPYAPLGVPLVDRDAADAVVTAVLDHVATAPDLPKLLLLPFIPEGPFAAVLARCLAARGAAITNFGTHRRALLVAAGAGPQLSAKRRSELRRQRRRLEEAGAVAFASASAAAPLAAGLADFFQLEAGGWKGRAGSAAAGHPATAEFMQAAVLGLAATGQARVDRLLADGRAVAAGITLMSGDTAWFWKIAYDETHARASPGMQIAAAPVSYTHLTLPTIYSV